MFSECKLENGTDHFLYQPQRIIIAEPQAKEEAIILKWNIPISLKSQKGSNDRARRVKKHRKKLQISYSLSTRKPLHLSGTWKIGIHTKFSTFQN